VVVVDNAPEDDTTRLVCEQYEVRYVREEHRGLCRARNRGIVEARGDLVALTDDDCVVDEAWLEGLDAAFADPLLMAVTGYVGPLELEHPAQFLFEVSGGFHRGFRRVLWDGLVDPPSVAGRVGAGANAVFRRRAFEEIGLFAEDLDAGTPAEAAGDTDLFYRLLAAGYRVLFDPARIVWHRHRADERALRRLLFGYSVGIVAVSLRWLIRHRDPGALRVLAWLYGRHMLARLRLLLRRDDHRLSLRLLLAELAGGLIAPYRLVRSRLSRRMIPPLVLPPSRPLLAVSVVESESPALSVVVPSYNRREDLRRVLEGLARQTYPAGAFEAVVVLDGSRDGSAEMVRSLEVPFSLRLLEQRNAGAAAARNAGATEAVNPIVAFLDDDIVPETAFVAEHAAAHRTGSDRVIVGYCPPVIERNDLWSMSLRAWWEDHFRRKAEPGHQWTFIDFTVGNSSLSRTLFLESGGLDRSFANRGREDWEIAVRLMRAGVPFAYRPQAVGRHYIDTRLETRLRQARQEARDDVLFASKHPHVTGQLLLGTLAEELGARPSSRALSAYRHARVSDAVVASGRRLLPVYEALGMRARWLRLTQNLLGLVYLRGVADVLDTPERFLSFFAPTWRDDPTRVDVSLDGQAARPAPPWAGSIELVFSARGHETVRMQAFPRGGQWSWDEAADRALAQALPIRAARMLEALETLPQEHARPETRDSAHAR
jgi:GT2 family glycosyltransferase